MKKLKHIKLFEEYHDFEIGDNTEIGRVDDVTDSQVQINGNWYAKKIIKPIEKKEAIEDREPLYVDEHGKNIVWDNKDGILIAVDDMDNPKYISLWDMKKESRKKIGFLIITSSIMMFKGDNYHKVDSVEIDKEYRGNGYGNLLYKFALKYLKDDAKGLVSYLPDRVNKLQVPKIYKRFNNEIIDDYHLIHRD